jgi:hypothetical protein
MTVIPATADDLEMGTDMPQAPGTPQEGVVYDNYWGVDETFKYDLPDGKQFFEIRPMNEGAKVRFQKLTNKAVRMNQQSGEASFDIDPAEERHTLILQSVIGWKIMQPDPQAPGGFSEYPCPPEGDSRQRRALEGLLERFNPKVIQDLEFFIRQKNPWMQADMSIEDIDKEIDRLEQLKRDKRNEAAGEESSANK